MFIYTLILVLLVQALYVVSTDLLFIPHDAGESNFILPILDAFLADTKSANALNISILTLGKPATEIFQPYQGRVNVLSLSDLGIPIIVEDGTSDRAQLLTASELTMLTAQLNPCLVVEGMVYQMQAQIGASLHSSHAAYIIGIYDSFSLWTNTTISSEYFVQSLAIDECFLCAKEQSAGVVQDSGSTIQPTVTGSPTLSQWASIAANATAVSSARAKMFATAQMPLSSSSSSSSAAVAAAAASAVAVSFAGGYGLPGGLYDKSLAVLCATATAAATAPGSGAGSYTFFFTPHPGYPSSYEESFFRQHGCVDYITIITPTLELDTALVFAASNVTMSQCSTTGGQSIAIGIPHIYIPGDASSTSMCIDVFTEATPTLIQNANDSTHVMQVLRELSGTVPPYRVSKDVMQEAGVPLDAVARSMKRFNTLLQK
jgi:hypothetical protein